MSNRGNVFIVIVAVLGIIFTMATFFMQATIEEKGQTEYSHRAVQTQCLAEAAMERAVRLLNQEMNDPEKAKDKTTIAGKLRQPMSVAAGSTPGTSGLGSSLGQDEPLVVPDDMAELIVMKKEDLQLETHELDELVTFMVGDDQKVKYEVEVKVGLSSAYRVAPGPSVEDAAHRYYVPAVDVPWSINPLVKGFLENKGFVALRMKFPDDWKWLQFCIPIKIGPLTIYEVDLVDLLNKAFPATSEYTQYFEVHKLLATLFPSFYPYDIVFAKDIFPSLADKLGPGVTPPPLDPKKPMEKYGFMSLESKATITFPDSRSITRNISASKEFKCADVQPIAPLHSLFVSNLKDEALNLNDIGGNVYVNNFAGFGAVKNGPGADNKEKYEFPGLVRFNGNKPMVCNVSFIGNPMGPSLGEGGNDGVLAKLGRGAEVPIMLDLGCEMDGIDTLGKDANLVAFVPKKYQDKYSAEINSSVTWAEHSTNP
ncbi:MAG TPA: hypothetical protein PKO06_07930, partial [Candidatus Ozemobacteraceae bacterium]|nr:hypothetical protein [Candidatus Ozemobacteraceae bacterium]